MVIRKTAPLLLGISLLTGALAQPAWADGGSCKVVAETQAVPKPLAPADMAAANPFKYQSEFNVNDYKGKTFFSVMRRLIKPSLDQYAKNGFQMASQERLTNALKQVDPKVRAQALKAAGTEDVIYKVAAAVTAMGKPITNDTLPGLIGDTKIPCDRYKLSTFLELASGGGVAIRLDSQNASFSVGYDTGEGKTDAQSGRSFAAGNGQGANDISDKDLLVAIQTELARPDHDAAQFTRAYTKILLNCDTSDFDKLSPSAKNLMNNLLAVYVAELDRNLMSNLKSHAWEQALFTVSSLAQFQMGLDTFMTMFNGQLVATVPNQEFDNKPRTNIRQANETDWWQVSTGLNPKGQPSNRSGINEEKRDFSLLGLDISNYFRTAQPSLVTNLETALSLKPGGNLYDGMNNFIINMGTAEALGDTAVNNITESWVDFVVASRTQANQIKTWILQKQGPVAAPIAKAN